MLFFNNLFVILLVCCASVHSFQYTISRMIQNSVHNDKIHLKMNMINDNKKYIVGLGLSSLLFFQSPILPSFADDNIKNIPLYTQRDSQLQGFSDVTRGFKMLRPFGFNEFDGAGGGYVVKFASLFDVDENVIVGSAPASAGKTSITDYGSLESVGEKLASKRGGKLIESESRVTEGYTFYKYKFENPLDMTLPRTGPKDKRPTVGVELYQLCVGKGRLWSVQATSNDILFKNSEKKLQSSMYSFLPRL